MTSRAPACARATSSSGSAAPACWASSAARSRRTSTTPTSTTTGSRSPAAPVPLPAPSTPRSTMPTRRPCGTRCAPPCRRARSHCRRAPGSRWEPLRAKRHCTRSSDIPAHSGTPTSSCRSRNRLAVAWPLSNDREVAVSERASNLVGGICGLAAVALFIGSFPLTGATPDPGSSADDVAEYLSRSSAQTWTGIYLELLGVALLIVFLGRLWALLRHAEGEGGWIATTGLGAALAAVTVLVIGDATMMGAAFSAGRHGLDPAVVGGMYTVQWYADLVYGSINA